MLLLVCNLLFYLSFVASPIALQRSIGTKIWRYKLFHKGFKTPRCVEVIKSEVMGCQESLSTKTYSASYSVLQKLTVLVLRFPILWNLSSISYLSSGLEQNGDFSEIFRVYSSPNWTNIYSWSAVTRYQKLLKARFLEWVTRSESGVRVWVWIKFHNIWALKQL